jgi:electron transport protein HydN
MQPRFPTLDPTRCTPCGACEHACVDARYGAEGLAADDPFVLERRRLAIRVIAGVPSLDVCVHCADSPCVPVCPHLALLRYPGGRVELIEPRCTGCGHCIAACPYKAIRRVTALGIAVKCDGCRALPSGPACAPACPTGALTVAF